MLTAARGSEPVYHEKFQLPGQPLPVSREIITWIKFVACSIATLVFTYVAWRYWLLTPMGIAFVVAATATFVFLSHPTRGIDRLVEKMA